MCHQTGRGCWLMTAGVEGTCGHQPTAHVRHGAGVEGGVIQFEL
jgi:hypothetical protein